MATTDEKKPGPKATEKKSVGYAWVVLDGTGAVHMVEGSQLRAAMAAIAVKGEILKWPFGATRAEAEAAWKP